MYGSAKSSSGSTPSESSGSAPDDSSSSNSGVIDGGSSSAESSASSGSSSSESCSYYIQIAIYQADDRMEVFLFNDGGVTVTVTGVVANAPATITPALPISMAAGTGTSFVVETPGNDLRGTTFTVETTCGDQIGTFPTS